MKENLILTIIFSTQLLLADGNKEDLISMCKRDLKKIENCCLTGDCIVKDIMDENSYALLAGPEEMRPIRRVCQELLNQKPETCGNDEHLQINEIIIDHNLSDKKSAVNCKSGGITRHTVLKVAKTSFVNSIDIIGQNLIQQCKNDLKNLNSIYTDLPECDLKDMSDKIILNTMAHLTDKNRFKNEFVKNFSKKSCPQIIDWNGYYKKPISYGHPELKIQMSKLFLSAWGLKLEELPENSPLISHECVHRASQRTAPKAGMACDEMYHYHIDYAKDSKKAAPMGAGQK